MLRNEPRSGIGPFASDGIDNTGDDPYRARLAHYLGRLGTLLRWRKRRYRAVLAQSRMFELYAAEALFRGGSLRAAASELDT